MATVPLQNTAAELQLLGCPPSARQETLPLPNRELVWRPGPSRSTSFLPQHKARAQDKFALGIFAEQPYVEWNIWTKLRGRVNSTGHHGELVRQVKVAISASVLFTKGRQEGNTWNKLTLLKFIPVLEAITITTGRQAITGVQQKHGGSTGFNVEEAKDVTAAKDGRWLALTIRKGLVNEE